MLASSRTPRRRKHTGWAGAAGRRAGQGTPRPQTLRRCERLRVGLAPLSKGAGCGESRRLGDCLEAGSRSRKAAQGGTLRVGSRFRGRHFGAGQSLRPRLAARPPPFDKGGKLQGGACNQPGNRDLDVIANPCRGRFYIGPVFDTANVPGRIWNPPLQWFFQCCSQPGNHDPRVTANLCRGRCYIGPVCDAANVPGRIWNPPLQNEGDVAAASGGGISGRGNPSDRAWRRGHLPLTREANCGAGPATNRETVILMLLRTRVGADSISARSAMPRTPAGGYGIRPYMGFPRYPAAPGCGFR